MILTDAQLRNQISLCEYCEEKPCSDACPAGCSPADFLMAAKQGEPSDYLRSAMQILKQNPLGGVCGHVCPDKFCLQACTRTKLDNPVNIPDCQATIISKARESWNIKCQPAIETKSGTANKKIAVIGSGPSGWSTAVSLSHLGYQTEIFEEEPELGGAMRYIPDERLDKQMLLNDMAQFANDNITTHFSSFIEDPESLLPEFDAVVVSTGLWDAMALNLPNAEAGMGWDEFLMADFKLDNLRVAIIGGGAIAVDCGVRAVNIGAAQVDLIMLENLSEMLLSHRERDDILAYGLNTVCRTKLIRIDIIDKIANLTAQRVELTPGKTFALDTITDIKATDHLLGSYDCFVWAIGSRSTLEKESTKPEIFYTGDMANGASTVVEAVASGKNTAQKIDAFLLNKPEPVIENMNISDWEIPELMKNPVNLECEFFGRKLLHPFILSAAPPTDGYEQMKKAFDAGWAGGIMKTVFDNLEIHIPSEYMFMINENTYANCDNVSEHPLSQTAKEATKLINEYPDRLIMVSTGGPVSGNDKEDRIVWQSNTQKLESAGVHGIEYSLSCPQGGDGTEGDIVAQNAQLSAKIVEWVMEISAPEIPKLFKLTGAVTSIVPILRAIKQVFEKFPDKKAGITLANTFPALAFRNSEKGWDEGVVVGLSGDGVKNISNLTIANAASVGLNISGNGGPMDYKAAANFLALGAKTVQFCTAPTKYGLSYITELTQGLSYYMQQKNIASVDELIGYALPNPVTDFMDLSGVLKISDRNEDLCASCGNCARCPYLAISLSEDKIPVTDAERCIGCSICVQKCFTGAMFMREREEAEV